jgi:phospholipid/cholesterol/gamma-HCH transport system ATP-binding protein
MRRGIRRRVREALQAVGLDPDIVLELDRDALSGGMVVRVAIARALSKDPILIFYDEPTTGLDPDHARQIQDLITTMHSRPAENGGTRTTVIITHDKDLLRRLEPRIVMLYKGRVFFDGSYRSFEQSDSPVIRPYFDLMPGLHQRERSAQVVQGDQEARKTAPAIRDVFTRLCARRAD